VSKCIRLAVFTFFAAFVFGLIACGESLAKPYIPDEQGGREVGRVMHDGKGGTKYVSTVPKPRPKPVARPVAKKPAPKPEIKQYVPKPVPKPIAKKPYTKYNLDKVAGKTIGGVVIGGVLAPFTAGTSVPAGAGIGAAGGALWENWDWAWENKARLAQDVIDQAGKISKVEDPMGKSFPH
jgi:hypothetical protein